MRRVDPKKGLYSSLIKQCTGQHKDLINKLTEIFLHPRGIINMKIIFNFVIERSYSIQM